MLAQDVRALAKDEAAPLDVRRVAERLADRYAYPVDFQVIDVEGALYAQAEANKERVPYRVALNDGLERTTPLQR